MVVAADAEKPGARAFGQALARAGKEQASTAEFVCTVCAIPPSLHHQRSTRQILLHAARPGHAMSTTDTASRTVSQLGLVARRGQLLPLKTKDEVRAALETYSAYVVEVPAKHANAVKE